MTAANDQKHARGGWYRRFLAGLTFREMESYNRMVANRKHELFSNLSGTVLEIGAGTGANLEFLPADIQYITIEPSLAMQEYLEAETARRGITADIRTGIAEEIPLEDQSVDYVISTLVLCSVQDVPDVVAEIHRVLKPGGKYLFLEHVAAPEKTWMRRWQNIATPAWKIIGDGCHLNRETWKAVEMAGFSQIDIDHFKLPVGLSGPHISGVAVK
ncbi:MAG: class I SAM-dependent methyltransferase [Chloroflexi bacterium]|nr:class I SAM-dependent methyltransferase [Chloroflexota bacterium]